MTCKEDVLGVSVAVMKCWLDDDDDDDGRATRGEDCKRRRDAVADRERARVD